MLGARKEAADFYPTVAQAIDATGTLLRFFATGLVQTVAGIAAASGDQWEKAEAHFQLALRQAHEFPHRLEQPEVRRWYARMLIDRGAQGDSEKARQFLSEAISMYREIGMPRHIQIAETMLGEARTATSVNC